VLEIQSGAIVLAGKEMLFISAARTFKVVRNGKDFLQ